ncbi:MAG TPA: hypothetical protein VNI35_03205, partial [Nitrospira sp.]|nr:hypothetical protein [Nitrospira sp.]
APYFPLTVAGLAPRLAETDLAEVRVLGFADNRVFILHQPEQCKVQNEGETITGACEEGQWADGAITNTSVWYVYRAGGTHYPSTEVTAPNTYRIY